MGVWFVVVFACVSLNANKKTARVSAPGWAARLNCKNWWCATTDQRASSLATLILLGGTSAFCFQQ